jgi:mannose/fructose/N-acetylgalactosamine-specific phosphotransferase system component IID
MGAMVYIKDIVTIAAILGLFVVGGLITLKSGVVTMEGEHCRLVRSNLSQLILTLGGCLIFLSVVQEIVGFRLGFPW